MDSKEKKTADKEMMAQCRRNAEYITKAVQTAIHDISLKSKKK